MVPVKHHLLTLRGEVDQLAPRQVGAGLGTTTSAGTVTLIAPTNIIEKDGQKEVIDGLTYDFMLAPGSEAPSEMLWYIEEKKLIEQEEDRLLEEVEARLATETRVTELFAVTWQIVANECEAAS